MNNHTLKLTKTCCKCKNESSLTKVTVKKIYN